MKIGITGGTGFVGTALIDRLLASDCQLKCVARDVERAKQVRSSEQLVWKRGDLGNDRWHAEFVEGCEAIVHSGLWRSSKSFQAKESDLVEYLRINFLGTIQLIEAAIKANVKRFVFVSSCAVHDKILDDRPLDETHPLWASNHYGAHKAAIEKFVHSYGLGGDIEICAVRPTGIYGVAHPQESSKWFSLIQSIAANENVSVSRGGKEVHVRDVAKAIEVLIHADANVSGQAYACYDQYISEYHIASLAKEFLGSHSQIDGESKTPRHQIVTEKIEELGMTFGGEPLLQETVKELCGLFT